MRGREIERELQVNESEIFAAAPAKGGTESIEHLGSPRLRRVDHQWELLAGLELVHRLHDKWMARQRFLECGEDLQGVLGISLSREKASISLNHAECRGVELIGAFEVLGCLLPLTGKVEDQRGMQLFEYRVPIGAGELIDGIGRLLRLGRICHRPGRQQRRSKIGDRSANRLSKLFTCRRVLLLFDRAHPENEPCDAVVLVDLQNALSKLNAFVNFAVGKHRQESAAKQLIVTRIAAQCSAVIGRRRRGIALAARVPSGEIAACRRGAREALTRLLRPSTKHRRPSDGECSHCGHRRTPQRWRKDHGRLHLADERPRRGRIEQNELFGPGSQ